MAEGIEVRVAKDGTRTYRASVWSNRDRRLVRKSFPSEAAAETWRHEAATAVKTGRVQAVALADLHGVSIVWLLGLED